jgi:hypothetical protein
MSNCRRPDAAAVLRFVENIERLLALENVIYEPPVDQIFRMQDRQARRGVEARRRHIEIVADSDGVRVGIIGVQNRVFESPVAVVCPPDL